MKRFLFLTIAILYSTIGQAQTSEDKLVKSIFFGGGSYYINNEQKDEIESFIKSFKDIQNYEIVISGHTDNIGGKEYNEWLSQMRNLAVRRQLLKIHVPEDIISTKEFGQNNPLYNNQSNSGRQANRRVDIILLPIIF